MQKKFKKMFFLFQTMEFERAAEVSLNYDENTCDQEATCYQTVLRFHIGRTEKFSDSIRHGLMEN